MNKNKYANYGKMLSGDDMFGYGIDRYQDILRQAEENRQANLVEHNSAKPNPSPLKMVWQILTHIF